MQCLADDGCAAQRPADVEIPFPSEAKGPAEPVESGGEGQKWRAPTTLAGLAKLMSANRDRKVRLVHGNTSYGVYKEEFPSTRLFVDIRLVPELHKPAGVHGSELVVAAGHTYSDLIEIVRAEMTRRRLDETTPLGAIDFMARRTAGRIVRNAASLAGNTMLVLKHIAGTEAPFASDLFTALVAVDAKITYLELDEHGNSQHRTALAADLVAAVIKNPKLADDIVLTSYRLPIGGARESVLAQKVALRDVNAHSIVNATTRFTFSRKLLVEQATLVFGGIAPFPWRARKTEDALRGKILSLGRAAALADILEKEVRAELKRWEARTAGVPNEGFTAAYRVQLAVSFLYKAIVNALIKQRAAVPPDVASSGIITWGHWPASDGCQMYPKEPVAFKKPVAQPYIRITAMYQTSGQLHYTQELPVPPLTVNGAFVQSTRALASYRFVRPGSEKKVSVSALREHLSSYSGSFVDLITSDSIRHGGINHQGMGADQPLFAEDMVNYVGQSIALVLATTEQEAIRIADYVTNSCVAYRPVDWPAPWNKPITSLEEAIKLGSIFPDTPKAASFLSHIWKITRPGSRFDWTRAKDPLDRGSSIRKANVDGAPCVVVENTQVNGGQAHFYMETQACIALPANEGRMHDASLHAEPDGDAPDRGDGAGRPVQPRRRRSRAGRRRFRRQDRAGALCCRPHRRRRASHQASGARGSAARWRHEHDRQAARLLRAVSDRRRSRRRAAAGQGHHPWFSDEDVGRRRRVLRLLVHRFELHPAAHRQCLQGGEFPEPDRRLPHQYRTEHGVSFVRRRAGKEHHRERHRRCGFRRRHAARGSCARRISTTAATSRRLARRCPSAT